MRSTAHQEKIQAFTAALGEIITHSLIAPGRVLRWLIIANPNAGGFTIPARWKHHAEALGRVREKALGNPAREGLPAALAGPQGLILTASAGHAGHIIRGLPAEAVQTGGFYLIITAGGDGTSREALNVLYSLPSEFRSQCVILRLPLGTGNDGADAWELADALDLLLSPAKVCLSRALSLTTAMGRGPFYAFNVLSVGLDAFVTHMTNKMKGRLPGDSYKLWVDIAALLYDRLYHVGPITVRAFDDDGNSVKFFQEPLLLLAMGVSGGRTYGSHKWILPDERNVCALKQMSLLRKLTLKGLFDTGTHIDKPEALLFNAHRLEIQGTYPILAQMDGETLRLQPEDFPAVIELTDPAIAVLRRQRGRKEPGGYLLSRLVGQYHWR